MHKIYINKNNNLINIKRYLVKMKYFIGYLSLLYKIRSIFDSFLFINIFINVIEKVCL